MIRNALLIGSPGTRGSSTYLGGVAQDLKNYDTFLRSPLGGAWSSDEITTLDDPSRAAVLKEKEVLKRADYSLVLFSGHGYYSEPRSSTIACLRDATELDTAELRTGAEKHTLILDCCREVEKAIIAEDALARVLKKAATLNERDCRRFYDARIVECGRGLIVLFACDVDERAGDDSRRGGYYAYNLISAAQKWAENSACDTSQNYDIFDVPGAHEQAFQNVQRLSGNRQNPQIEKPRSGKHFPFAIVA